MKTLVNKVALVTGASKGIGAATAKKLAAEGAAVVVNYAGSQAAAEQVVADIIADGGKAIAVYGDVSKRADVNHLFDEAINNFGKLDILVNNAGIMGVKPLKDTTEEDFDKHFNINTKGTYNTLHEAATRLEEGGRIINFSTTVTRMNFPGYTIYTATKAAVDQMTRIFAKEIASRKITVNSVQPGPTNTELFVSDKSEDVMNRIKSQIPFNRLAQPEEIANVVAFLASDDAGWVTGQNIAVNGGMA